MIRRNLLSKSLERISERVALKTDNYLEDPNAENVHDLRTAIRRMRVAVSLLPKKQRGRRKSKVGRYSAKVMELFRLTTGIRDVDIILERLSNYPATAEIERLGGELANERESIVSQTQQVASRLRGSSSFKMKKRRLSNSKLERAFADRELELLSGIDSKIKIVTRDEKAVEDLHALRKDCKRLRYLVELDPDPASEEKIRTLSGWQDLLGAIHDQDMMISRLGRRREVPRSLQSTLESEKAERKSKYEEFLKIVQEGHGEATAAALIRSAKSRERAAT